MDKRESFVGFWGMPDFSIKKGAIPATPLLSKFSLRRPNSIDVSLGKNKSEATSGGLKQVNLNFMGKDSGYSKTQEAQGSQASKIEESSVYGGFNQSENSSQAMLKESYSPMNTNLKTFPPKRIRVHSTSMIAGDSKKVSEENSRVNSQEGRESPFVQFTDQSMVSAQVAPEVVKPIAKRVAMLRMGKTHSVDPIKDMFKPGKMTLTRYSGRPISSDLTSYSGTETSDIKRYSDKGWALFISEELVGNTAKRKGLKTRSHFLSKEIGALMREIQNPKKIIPREY